SERSNNILLRIPLAIEEEIFDEDIFDKDIPDGSIPYHTIQLTASIKSQRESAQEGLKHVLSVMNLIHYAD
ncbi:17706_t:CDS:1, partial [Funneliformis caledonium]